MTSLDPGQQAPRIFFLQHHWAPAQPSREVKTCPLDLASSAGRSGWKAPPLCHPGAWGVRPGPSCQPGLRATTRKQVPRPHWVLRAQDTDPRPVNTETQRQEAPREGPHEATHGRTPSSFPVAVGRSHLRLLGRKSLWGAHPPKWAFAGPGPLVVSMGHDERLSTGRTWGPHPGWPLHTGLVSAQLTWH